MNGKKICEKKLKFGIFNIWTISTQTWYTNIVLSTPVHNWNTTMMSYNWDSVHVSSCLHCIIVTTITKNHNIQWTHICLHTMGYVYNFNHGWLAGWLRRIYIFICITHTHTHTRAIIVLSYTILYVCVFVLCCYIYIYLYNWIDWPTLSELIFKTLLLILLLLLLLLVLVPNNQPIYFIHSFL